MSNDAPIISARRSKTRRWIALGVTTFLTWFLWQLFGPNPPIIVSKETTYITAPLRPNGLPDYRHHLYDRLRDGITVDNNAAVLMWQAYGPGRGSSALKTAEWEHIVRELNLPHADSTAALVDPTHRDMAERVEHWVIANDPIWKQAATNAPDTQDGNSPSSDLGFDAVFATIAFPWRREQLPPLAEWADANSEAIDSLVKASQRPRLYLPYDYSDSDDDLLAEMLPMEGIMKSRAAARILAIRAMLHIGEGRHAEAWQDVFAIHRWARLIGQGPTLVEQLVAIALDGIACDATAALLASGDLQLDLAQQIQQELQSLSPPADLARSFDEGERYYFLEMITFSQDKGIGALVADNVFMGLGDSDHAAWTSKLLNRVSADWNVALTEGNRWYDRLANAARLPNVADRKRAFSQLEHELRYHESSFGKTGNWIVAAFSAGRRNKMLANAMIAAISPSVNATLEANDRANATLELTQLAAALAVYRAEHGNYPDRLDQLVPDVIPKLPVDLFHDKQYIYQRDADGYLLYSCGPNGNDDGGSGHFSDKFAGRPIDSLPQAEQDAARKQMSGSADDISLRLPRPPFKLPTPPTGEL